MATPKLPPPPRSAHNRSGCALASTCEHLALRGHELGADQVVGREPVLAHQPAEAAAERQAGDAGARDRAAGDREPVLAGGGVELAPGHAAARASRSPRSGSTAIAFISARSIITPPSVTARPATLWPPPRTETSSPLVARKRERADDVVGAAAAHDQRRPPVDQPVVDRAGLVVAGVLGPEDALAETIAKGGAHGELPSRGSLSADELRRRSFPQRKPYPRWLWPTRSPSPAGPVAGHRRRGGPQEAAQRAFTNDPGGTTAYGTSVGYVPLREWIAEQHGVERRPGAGHQRLDAGRRVPVPAARRPRRRGDRRVPHLRPHAANLRNRGADVRMVELETDGIDVDGARVAARRRAARRSSRTSSPTSRTRPATR